MLHLLTQHGTLLSWDERTGQVVQRAFDTVDPACPPVALGLDWEALLRNAEAGGPAATALPLPPASLGTLRALVANHWISARSGQFLRPGDIRVRPGFLLDVAGVAYDLRQQLPLDQQSSPFRVTLLREGWRIETLCLYRPLVTTVAIGPAAHEHVRLMLHSLAALGRYDGAVHAITDLTAAALARLAPGLDPAKLSVQRIASANRIEAVAARYTILDWPAAARHQPILYVDADTVFDADIAPLLASVAIADRILAPAEPFSPRRSAPSAGADLLAADAVDPAAACGFNTGTLGIPNLPDHAGALRLIRRIIGNRTAGGVRLNSWVDQPVANYVDACVGGFDTERLNRFVRSGFPAVAADPHGRRGLVHFWPPRDPARKLAAMRAYLTALQGAFGESAVADRRGAAP